METVSPELALVDPALAERARTRLAPTDDTLARVDILVEASRMASLARRSMEVPERRASAVVESTRQIPRIGQRQSAIFAGGVAAVTLVIALLVGVRVDLTGTPAGADTTVIHEAPAPSVPGAPPPSASTQPKASRPQRETKPAPQRFAWAPSPGASGYHIELFRGSSKVFEADTTRPSLTIPAHWVFERKRRILQPGNYRWYVWPLTSGTRAAKAVVQATLTVTPR